MLICIELIGLQTSVLRTSLPVIGSPHPPHANDSVLSKWSLLKEKEKKIKDDFENQEQNASSISPLWFLHQTFRVTLRSQL